MVKFTLEIKDEGPDIIIDTTFTDYDEESEFKGGSPEAIVYTIGVSLVKYYQFLAGAEADVAQQVTAIVEATLRQPEDTVH